MTSLLLTPSVGYFFKDRLAGGLRVGLNQETLHYVGAPVKTRNSSFLASAFCRYYVLPKEKKINVFADIGYGLEWGKYTNFVDINYSYDNSILSFYAGPAFFLIEHTSLELTLGYIRSSRGSIDTTRTNSLQFGIGLQIHLGKNQ
jgi:hypothetical protein